MPWVVETGISLQTLFDPAGRWAGAWGIEADFGAKTKCSVLCISAEDLQVCFCYGHKGGARRLLKSYKAYGLRY